jgi:hypothetical protein
MSFVVVMMRKHGPTTTGQRTHTRRRIDPFFQLRAERDVPIGARPSVMESLPFYFFRSYAHHKVTLNAPNFMII